MSDIPKSKRAWSKLEALDKAIAIRGELSRELLISFGLSQKHIDAAVKKATKGLQGEEKDILASKIREMYAGFIPWFIERHRNRVDDLAGDIEAHIRGANKIWPVWKFEYDDRRQEWNEALKACDRLQGELQFIAEQLPADKNRYKSIVLEIDDLDKMIKKIRQSDNRFLPHLKA